MTIGTMLLTKPEDRKPTPFASAIAGTVKRMFAPSPTDKAEPVGIGNMANIANQARVAGQNAGNADVAESVNYANKVIADPTGSLPLTSLNPDKHPDKAAAILAARAKESGGAAPASTAAAASTPAPDGKAAPSLPAPAGTAPVNAAASSLAPAAGTAAPAGGKPVDPLAPVTEQPAEFKMPDFPEYKAPAAREPEKVDEYMPKEQKDALMAKSQDIKAPAPVEMEKPTPYGPKDEGGRWDGGDPEKKAMIDDPKWGKVWSPEFSKVLAKNGIKPGDEYSERLADMPDVGKYFTSDGTFKKELMQFDYAKKFADEAKIQLAKLGTAEGRAEAMKNFLNTKAEIDLYKDAMYMVEKFKSKAGGYHPGAAQVWEAYQRGVYARMGQELGDTAKVVEAFNKMEGDFLDRDQKERHARATLGTSNANTALEASKAAAKQAGDLFDTVMRIEEGRNQGAKNRDAQRESDDRREAMTIYQSNLDRALRVATTNFTEAREESRAVRRLNTELAVEKMRDATSRHNTEYSANKAAEGRETPEERGARARETLALKAADDAVAARRADLTQKPPTQDELNRLYTETFNRGMTAGTTEQTRLINGKEHRRVNGGWVPTGR